MATPETPPAQEGLPGEESRSTGLLGRLRTGLAKTRSKVAGGLRSALSLHRELDEDVVDEIEEQLYLADVGPRAVMRFCEDLRQAYRDGNVRDAGQVVARPSRPQQQRREPRPPGGVDDPAGPG